MAVLGHPGGENRADLSVCFPLENSHVPRSRADVSDRPAADIHWRCGICHYADVFEYGDL